MCFVPQFSVHKMAVPLSQRCSEDKALKPMRCCGVKLRGYARKLFEPPPMANLSGKKLLAFKLVKWHCFANG